MIGNDLSSKLFQDEMGLSHFVMVNPLSDALAGSRKIGATAPHFS
jgi:acetaldehyde dehydrogenase (acetylating)